MDMVSIDQSKASTSSNGKQATIKFKKHPDKSSSPDYQAVAVKEIKEHPGNNMCPPPVYQHLMYDIDIEMVCNCMMESMVVSPI